MPTLNLQVASSAGDAHAGSIANDSGRTVTSGAHILSSPNGLTSTILSPGSHGSGDEYSAAARFVSVTVPQGATISSATFKMTAQTTYNAGANTISYLVSAEASDNAPALTNSGAGSSLRISGETTLGNRPRTTAVSSAWNQNSVAADTEYSIDITSVVQEIVNRAGWASGNAIVIVVDTNTTCTSGEWQDYYSYDGSTTKAPKLDITYTTGGGAQTITGTGLSSLEAFGTAVVTPGAIAATPSAIASAEAFGTATITVGGVVLAPTGIASLEAFGTAAATPGAVTVAPTGIASLEAFGTAAVSQGALSLAPSAVDSAEAFGSTTVSGPTSNYGVAFGEGYTDVSAKQLVRTSGNRLYIVAMECDAYPYESGDRLFVKRASSTGIPAGYSDVSSGDHTDVNTVACALDGSDKIHILMPTRSGSLLYRVWLTSTDAWEAAAATIDTGLETNTGQGDQQAALALDSDGIPHICYLKSDGTRRRLYYRNRVGGSWSAAELVDDQSFGTNERIWTPNIAFDTAGRRVFLWVRGTFNDTADGELFIRVRETNDTWGTTVMVSSANALLTGIDQSSSIVITPDNRYHVTWMNGSTTPSQKYIRYAYSDDQGATWTRNDPGSGTQATHNPSLGYAGGVLRIYGHGTPDSGNHGENLYYFEGDGGAATWSSWTQFVTGTNFDSSVATRWSQYHYHYPNTIDVAYWDDNYPNLLKVGTEVVALDIATTGIASLEAFGTATAANVTTLAPSAVASLEAFGTATVTPGTATVAPSAVASGEAFGTAAVVPGAVTVAPSAVASGEAFGSATVAPGAATVAPSAITTAEAFGSATATPGAISVTPSAVSSAEAFGSATVSNGGLIVQPNGVVSAEAFGTTALVLGAATVAPSAIASAEAFGTAAVSSVLALLASAVSSAEAFGTAVIVSAATLSPSGIVSAQAFGAAVVTGGARITGVVTVGAITARAPSATVAGRVPSANVVASIPSATVEAD